MQKAIGLGDFEQPIEDIFQHRGAAAEHARDLGGVIFITGHILPGEIEHAPHIGAFAIGHLEDAFEGGDLIIADNTIGFRHFCRERNDRDGKRDAGIAVVQHLFVAVEQQMSGRGADNRADRTAAEQEPCRGTRDFSPDGHGLKH